MTHQTDARNERLKDSSLKMHVEVSRADLPLSCPQPDQRLWNAHPRVYLPIEETGEAVCPYCDTHYKLID